jgi:SP family general alpha glucoside:H+ symporter-like MFS transporter
MQPQRLSISSNVRCSYPHNNPVKHTNATAEAGIDNETAFALGLITSALQTVFVMLSWILTTYLGRRTIYLWGSGFNAVLLVCLGIAASVGHSNAQASLGLIVSVLFTLGPA